MMPPADGAVAEGRAFHYRPGLMRQVAQHRGLALDPTVDGYASTPDCRKIGYLLHARIAGQFVTLQQIDCSDPADLPRQRRMRLVVEIDWYLAQRLGFATYAGATGTGHADAIVYDFFRPTLTGR